MFSKILGCWIIVSHLSPYDNQPQELFLDQLNTCQQVTNEVRAQKADKYLLEILSITWQESRFKMDAKGRYLCTNGGTLIKNKNKKLPPTCTKGTLTRGRGPMQVLPVYHCPNREKGECNYLKRSVALFKRNVKKWGLKMGVEIYAGGYGIDKKTGKIKTNNQSKRYFRLTRSTARKLRKKLESFRAYTSWVVSFFPRNPA